MKKSIREGLLCICALSVLSFFSSCADVGSDSKNESSGSATITGKALYTNKNSHSGILITLIPTDGQVSADLLTKESVRSLTSYRAAAGSTTNETTREDGSYSFTNIIPGTYTIYASAENSSQKAVQTNVSVSENQNITVADLNLTATSTISGKISLDGSSTGNGGFIVFVSSTSFMAITGDDGSFTISGVPLADNYSVAIMKGSYYTLWKTQLTLTSAGVQLGTKSISTMDVYTGSGTAANQSLYGKVTFFEEPYTSLVGKSSSENLVTTGTASFTWGENMPDLDGQPMIVESFKKSTVKDKSKDPAEDIFTGLRFYSQKGNININPWLGSNEVIARLSFPITAIKDSTITSLTTKVYHGETSSFRVVVTFNGENVYMALPDSNKVCWGPFEINRSLKAGETADIEITLYTTKKATSSSTEKQFTVCFAPLTLTVLSGELYQPHEITPKQIEITTTDGNKSIQGGDSLQLYANILPMNATNKEVIWSFSDNSNIISGGNTDSSSYSGTSTPFCEKLKYSYTFADIDENGLITTKKIPKSTTLTVRCTSKDAPYVYAEKEIYYHENQITYSLNAESDISDDLRGSGFTPVIDEGYSYNNAWELESGGTISFDVSGKCSISVMGYKKTDNELHNEDCSIKITAGSQQEGQLPFHYLYLRNPPLYYVYTEGNTTVTLTAPEKLYIRSITVTYDDTIEYIPVKGIYYTDPEKYDTINDSHAVYFYKSIYLRDFIRMEPEYATYADCLPLTWSLDEVSDYATISQNGELRGKNISVIDDKKLRIHCYGVTESSFESSTELYGFYFRGSDPYLQISAPSYSVAVGHTLQLTASISSPADALDIDEFNTFRWESDSPWIASVDENGLVTGVMPGRTYIRAAVPVYRYTEYSSKAFGYGPNDIYSSGYYLEVTAASDN